MRWLPLLGLLLPQWCDKQDGDEMAQGGRVVTHVVTGCAGFVGAALVRRLLADGSEVVGVDNLDDAYDVRMKEHRLEELLPLSPFCFVRENVCSPGLEEALRRAIGGGCVDTVFHLAARTGVRQSVEAPRSYVDSNVLGTLNVLEVCRRLGIERLVLASTSSVYGIPAKLPCSEEVDTSRPLSPYAASKIAAEALCHTYHYVHGLSIVVLRYFTVYGPAGRPDMSIFRWVRNILEGEPITVYGDGTQRRAFTFVQDVVEGTVAAGRLSGYHVLNLGGERSVELWDVVRTIEAATGCRALIRHGPAQPGEIPVTSADCRRARELLGWQPRVTLEDGLRATAAWYRENRHWAANIALGGS